jgi:hypothetical protein
MAEPGASFLSLWERSEVRVRSIATGTRRRFDLKKLMGVKCKNRGAT